MKKQGQSGGKKFPKEFYASVVFPIQDGRVCLAIKGRGIGQGRRNGYGGGRDKGENMLECTIRELHEEARIQIDPSSLKKVGFIKITNLNEDGSVNFTCHLHVLLLTAWIGEIQSTDEMLDPQWFAFDTLPVTEMMQADLVWLPRILAGESLKGELASDSDQKLVGTPVFVNHEFDSQDLVAS